MHEGLVATVPSAWNGCDMIPFSSMDATSTTILKDWFTMRIFLLYISDKVAVMNQGKIVEMNDTDAVFDNPQHDYTKALLSSIPIPDPEKERQRRNKQFYGV